MKKNCLICEKEFRTYMSAINRGGGKYCSIKCANVGMKKTKNQKINLACLNCGNKFYVSPSRIKGNLRKTCSIKCKAQLQEGKMAWNKGVKRWWMSNKFEKGKHPWNYRGITSFNQIERDRFRRELQKLIFERDHYTCQLCGSQKDLQVDHIQSWSEYVELRFNMDNCRTLCAKCHYLITFGKPMPENVKTWGQNFYRRKENK